MQTVETTSSVEARRCRRAQYCGRTAELSLNGSKILGMVRSVQEDRFSIPQRWIVTIVPTVGKPPLAGRRYTQRSYIASSPPGPTSNASRPGSVRPTTLVIVLTANHLRCTKSDSSD